MLDYNQRLNFEIENHNPYSELQFPLSASKEKISRRKYS